MIIIIPIGGIGERFKNNGYKKPKSLLDICGKPIIYYLLDNLKTDNIDYIFIPYNKEYNEYDFENLLINRYPKICFKFFCLKDNTRGAAETINIGIKELNESRDIEVICLDSDNFYLCDVISKWNGRNCVFSFKDLDEEPIFSYIKKDKDNKIIEIKEKEKISNYACSGAYGFKSIIELEKYTSKIIKENKTQKSEFYISGVIKEMINEGHTFKNEEILNKNYFSLGTPEQVKQYEKPFIFDLDGTLVDTDDIYTSVWKKIMEKYNLSVDNVFFKFFIQGKDDNSFLQIFFPNITEQEISEISALKDKLFIDKLKENDKDITIEGALDFIEKNKNRRMGIVTSCNKKSAKFILDKTRIGEYMQFLIASEDCNKNKPDKEPYQKAIDILQSNKKDCTIFEDSNSGYKSALSLGGTKICLIINDNSSEFIVKTNNYKIKNYNHFDYNEINNINDNNNIRQLIINKLNKLNVIDVKLNDKDLKTGYICDIKSLTLFFYNNNENVILKIENEDNELSQVARKINLYNNELYFYEKISNLVNCKIPKFYNSLTLDNKIAILLEDINGYKGTFNVDLNVNIDCIFSVVKNISNMHNRFYFKSQNDIIPVMEELLTINKIKYFEELINLRFKYFLEINNCLLSENEKNIINSIYDNYSKLTKIAGTFPLSFCHGDLKSPNIFYQEDSEITPIFLDWQYIHLNKGISDIVFLLVESTNFDEILNNIIINYYYKKSIAYDNIEDLLFDFKVALCIFPFFVLIWFNSENRDNLLDKIFPIRFLKNSLKFYNKYLDKDFFDTIKNM